MKIALAQINPKVAALDYNRALILDSAAKAVAQKVDLLVFPELALCGYPPQDLLEQSGFIEACAISVEQIVAGLPPELAILLGAPLAVRSSPPLANAALLIHNRTTQVVHQKMLLPNYDVFDERRYFSPGVKAEPFDFMGRKIGVSICEDAWNDASFWPQTRYDIDPLNQLAEAGAEIIINLSASPYEFEKPRLREAMICKSAARLGLPVLLCNQVGANDELIFDGGSFVSSATGKIINRAARFAEDLFLVDLNAAPVSLLLERDLDALYRALCLGVRDYMAKCGFKQALLGLSGGIDSALTAVIAADAIGPENVRGIAMPSRFSSQGSIDDAQALAAKLGIALDIIPITEAVDAYSNMLASSFAGSEPGIAEENIQARARGTLLMALSNKFGSLLLSTGNKSEMSVGYCTLYGDMNGGLAVIADLPKMLVYELCRWLNREDERIPENTITKPPSAELRPDQTDQDSLPPYDWLDTVLEAYVVQGLPPEQIAMVMNADPDEVLNIVAMVDRAEYKRRQAAPVLKVTSKAYGAGRRVPIAKGRWY